MLIKYQQLTRRLLNDATFARVNDFDLRDYINIGRGQIAIQGDAIPGYGHLHVDETTQQYSFDQITFDTPGVAGPLALETVDWKVGDGQRPMNAIDWARFNRYELGHVHPRRGHPRVWTQFGQGSAGTIFVNALDQPYDLIVKARVHPVDLVDDATPEALPYMWTDAVPWFAAFYWLAGPGQNPQLAQAMLSGFQQFMQMARGGANPNTQGSQFVQAPDPLMAGRLGATGGQGGRQPRQQTPPTAA